MKNKVLIFIIGMLIGAIIATTAFYIYGKTNNNQTQGNFNDGGMPQMDQENRGTPPDLPSGAQGNMSQMPSQNQQNGSTPPQTPGSTSGSSTNL